MAIHQMVYVVFDKTERNYHKPFVSIHLVESKAMEQVDILRSKVSKHAQKLIYMDAVPVDTML